MNFEVPGWHLTTPVQEKDPKTLSKRKKRRDRIKSIGSNHSPVALEIIEPVKTQKTKPKKAKLISLAPKPNTTETKASQKLSGARFRFLNQKLYEIQSLEATKYFSKNPEEFKNYHLGFREQIKAWPVNPVDVFIKKLEEVRDNGLTIADVGCGEAKIAETFANSSLKVHSFDLAAVNEHVTVSNMTSLPLEDKSIDVCIFSLSLMNTDYLAALKEAHRILKRSGQIWIAEVSSRFDGGQKGIEAFKDECCDFNFVEIDASYSVFVMFWGEKISGRSNSSKKNRFSSQKDADKKPLALKPCLYKKR